MAYPKLGAQMSIGGGVAKALLRGRDLGCETIQIFTRNSSRWQAKPLTDSQLAEFSKNRLLTGIRPVVAHDIYLINLASPDDKLYQRSIAAFWEELTRAEQLGLPYVVTHPGSHVGSGEEEGLQRIAQAISHLHRQGPDLKVQVALETTAGQGTNLGYRFEQLARLLELIEGAERVKVCLDTCHIFAAGYDIRTPEGYADVMAEFDRIIGYERLAVVHLNDAKRELGSRIDRHHHIGQGHLGIAPFECLLHDPRLLQVPMILETPKETSASGEDMDMVNLDLLRQLKTN